MAEEFPTLEAALGTLMFRIMSETLTTSTSPERMEKLEAVRQALISAWPEELKLSRERTVWRSCPDGGSQALYNAPPTEQH